MGATTTAMWFTFAAVFLLTCFAGTLGQEAGTAPPPASTSSSQKPETTSATPVTTESTPSTTPTTSTESPSTSTEPTRTSTEPTKPSTTAAPTSTVAPTSPPQPAFDSTHTWKMTNKSSNHTCVELQMAAQFKYLNKDNNLTEWINVSPNATVFNGDHCSKTNEQELVLSWPVDSKSYYCLTFSFTKNNKTNEGITVDLSNITLAEGEDCGNADKLETLAYLNTTSDIFKADVGRSYKCNTVTSISLQPNGSVDFKDLQVQAFMTSDNFGDAESCPADFSPSDIVPIAVGCALAGLVVIVLIAYVVGRRLSRKRGYQSV